MNNNRWRTVDIVVASVIAVAFGVIFWAWGLLWNGPFVAAFASFPPAAALTNGVWFIPAVLAPLILRKPGAALYTEMVAASLSAILGSFWGLLTLGYGAAQGAAGELAFATRRFGPTQAMLAGGLAGVAATALDLTTQSPGEYQTSWQIAYAACQIGSGIVIAGLGSYFLANALAKTGVLDRFPIGRARELV